AGCQGVLVLEAQFDGERAHTARPWMGRNAIHRAAEVLARLAAHESDTVVVDGLEYRESLQVVRVEGGIADKHNVVPDSCSLVVGRRFAPCYTIDDAGAQVRALLVGSDRVEVLQSQPAAPPNLTNPLVAGFVRDSGGRLEVDRERDAVETAACAVDVRVTSEVVGGPHREHRTRGVEERDIFVGPVLRDAPAER